MKIKMTIVTVFVAHISRKSKPTSWGRRNDALYGKGKTELLTLTFIFI